MNRTGNGYADCAAPRGFVLIKQLQCDPINALALGLMPFRQL